MFYTKALIWDICPASEGENKLYHHTMEIWFFLLSLWLSMQPTPPSAYTFESFSWFNYYYTLPTPLYIVQIYTYVYNVMCILYILMYIYIMSKYIYMHMRPKKANALHSVRLWIFSIVLFIKIYENCAAALKNKSKPMNTHISFCVYLFYFIICFICVHIFLSISSHSQWQAWSFFFFVRLARIVENFRRQYDFEHRTIVCDSVNSTYICRRYIMCCV